MIKFAALIALAAGISGCTMVSVIAARIQISSAVDRVWRQDNYSPNCMNLAVDDFNVRMQVNKMELGIPLMPSSKTDTMSLQP